MLFWNLWMLTKHSIPLFIWTILGNGESLSFPVAPGIHRKIATSSQQFFIKVEKVASFSRNGIINSGQGRGKDLAVMPL